jgi:hypothetical protein
MYPNKLGENTSLSSHKDSHVEEVTPHVRQLQIRVSDPLVGPDKSARPWFSLSFLLEDPSGLTHGEYAR